MVKIKFYGRLIDVAGEREINIPINGVETLEDLFVKLEEKLGDKMKAIIDEKGKPRAGILIMINGEAASFRGGLKAKLREGDEVVVDTIDIYEVEGGG